MFVIFFFPDMNFHLIVMTG